MSPRGGRAFSSHDLAEELSRPAKSSLGREARQGLFWTTAQSLFNRFNGFVVFLLLARLLQPRDFGLLAAAVVFVTLATLVAEAGLSRALIQRPTLRAAHLDTSLLLTALGGLMLSALLLLLAPAIQRWYDMAGLAPVLRAMALVPFLSALGSVPEGLLRRRLAFRSLALRSSVGAAVGGIVGVTMALLDMGVWALVGQLLSQQLLSLVVLWMAVRWVPGRLFHRDAATDILSFGSSFIGIQLLNVVVRRTPDLIIGAALGPFALGMYAVAQRAPTLLYDLVMKNANSVAMPVFSRGASDPERLRGMYVRALEVTAIVAFGAFLTASLVSQDLVPLLFGETWVRAGELMVFLLLLGPAQSMLVFTNSALLGSGRGRLAFGWTATSVGVRTAVAGLTIPYGLMPFAIASAVVVWLLLVPSLYLVRQITPVTLRDQVRAVRAPVVGGLLMSAIGWAAAVFTSEWPPIVRICFLAALALSVYAAVLHMLRPQTTSDVLLRAIRRHRTGRA